MNVVVQGRHSSKARKGAAAADYYAIVTENYATKRFFERPYITNIRSLWTIFLYTVLH